MTAFLFILMTTLIFFFFFFVGRDFFFGLYAILKFPLNLTLLKIFLAAEIELIVEMQLLTTQNSISKSYVKRGKK